MKNFNIEWVVPVIVAVVFVVGNIMRILNWKNEQDKKTTRRPREFQIPRRPQAAQPVRESNPPLMVEAVFPTTVQRVDPPPRPLGRLENPQSTPRSRPEQTALPEEVQRAIRRNRAKAQKKVTSARVVIEPTVLPVVEVVSPRMTRDDVPNPPAVVVPEGGQPAISGRAMSSLVTDLFRSPEEVTRAMVLQIIFSPPLSRRRFPAEP
jgi:hypothetical protein